MIKLELNIIDFIRHKDLLNDQSLSEAQVTVPKSLYGLPLTDKELEIYRAGTGRDHYEAIEQNEVTVIAGRRSGKTLKLAKSIGCYEASRDHDIPAGEEGFVMLIALTMTQARITLRSIRSSFRKSKILSQGIVGATKDEIRLDNGIVIGCYACTYDGVRGRTSVAMVCDELAFWSDGEESSNPAEEVLAALRPGMARVHNPKLVKISTPFGKAGLLFREFEERSSSSFPVWQLTIQEVNPTVPSSYLEEQKSLLSDEEFSREFLAKFTDTINGWIDYEILNPCVVRGRRELSYLPDASYAAALDPASRENDFTLAILHRLPDGMIVVDRLARWAGTKKAPLAFEWVLGEVKNILDDYNINSVVGDQFLCDPIAQHLLKLGVVYKISAFGPQTRAKLFANMKHLLAQRKIELLDGQLLLRQLLSLREEKTERGQVDVRPSAGQRDDLAIAVALAAQKLTNLLPVSTIELGIVDRSDTRLDLVPSTCPYQTICLNYPTCEDEGMCLGLKKDEKLLSWARMKV